MSYQDELMKDWSVEKRVQVLEIVARQYFLLAISSPEELIKFAETNQDAFDLFVAMEMDRVVKKYGTNKM